jgi:hypothetical protein
LSLDACLEKLRYVKHGDEVRASDVLAKLECLRALRDALKTKAAEMGCPSERVDPLVDQLDAIIAMIRYVRSGDIIQPEDHNYVVDALRRARDILSEIESWCTGLKDQLDKCVAELSECKADLSACLAKPPFKSIRVSASDISVGKPPKTTRVSASDVSVGKLAKITEIKQADVSTSKLAKSIEVKLLSSVNFETL